MQTTIHSEDEMKAFGAALAGHFVGGECIQLIGDVGAGKTTLVKGIGQGLGIDEPIQSPSFTISRVYDTDTLRLVHYDFYRLSDAGIMAEELKEALADPHTVVVIEWADIVAGVLPPHHQTIEIRAISETERVVTVTKASEGET